MDAIVHHRPVPVITLSLVIMVVTATAHRATTAEDDTHDEAETEYSHPHTNHTSQTHGQDMSHELLPYCKHIDTYCNM